MRLEVFADVVCPWCYIGKRRRAAAVEHLAQRHRITVSWRSFELDPGASRVPGRSAAEAMDEWYADRAPARVARIQALGAADGLALNLALSRPVNTHDAHRLCHLAADHGRADQMMERLLRAYHTEGLNVADPRTLQRLGGDAGLDEGDVRAVLAGDAYTEQVHADRRRAAELGVTGVPTIVIDGRAAGSAVQPPEDLRRLLEAGLSAE